MKVRILRQYWNQEQSYWETFRYEGSGDITVAGMLDDLNYKDDVTNEAGKIAPRIKWSCSCLQGMCGGCAMVINGRPALACETFLRDLGDEVVLEPLSKFPVICDLIVDRGIIYENLSKANAYIQKFGGAASHRSDSAARKEHDHQYTVAKCLKCGLCLEVCPNYVKGVNFFGPLFANDCYLISKRTAREKEPIKKEYEIHFGGGCSKSLACMDVCPMDIPTLTSMAKMNRSR